jgi:hypothetical protein
MPTAFCWHGNRHSLSNPQYGAAQAIANPPRLAELGLSPKTAITAILSLILEGKLTPEGRRKS